MGNISNSALGWEACRGELGHSAGVVWEISRLFERRGVGEGGAGGERCIVLRKRHETERTPLLGFLDPLLLGLLDQRE